MRIFNSVNKTKYFIALALLLAFAVFVGNTDTGETFVKPVKPNFPDKSNVFFDYENTHAAFISWTSMESFGSHEGVKGLKRRHRAIRQIQILPATKFVFEKYVNNVYVTVRVPYYAEVCKLLAQLIVSYLFMTDGKKRSLKLSYN